TSRIDPSVVTARPGSTRAPRSITVTMVPRTLISPRTYSGAPGRRVIRRGGMISCAERMSHPYKAFPARMTRIACVACSGVVAVEVKVLEWVGLSERYVRAGGGYETAAELLRQRRTQVDRHSGHRVTKHE